MTRERPQLKRCTKCEQDLPTSAYGKICRHKPELKAFCKKCDNKRNLEWHHRKGTYTPLAEAKNSSSYLGVYVAERALSKFFDNIIRMPYGNPGFDFICGKGFKIDVKSSCLQRKRDSYGWRFLTKRNKIADYFLCLAFDNRQSLEPQHVWLIPRMSVEGKTSIWITDTPRALVKWGMCERPLDKVAACCKTMRSVVP